MSHKNPTAKLMAFSQQEGYELAQYLQHLQLHPLGYLALMLLT